MTNLGNNSEIGEVIGSSNKDFTAESHILFESPAFGSFVKVKSKQDIYAVIINAYTNSMEPNRLAVAYRRSEQELRNEQPQIFELLRTKFEAVIVGYEDDERIRFSLPPQPPKIHSFIYKCSDSEVKRVTSNSWFLRFLTATANAPTDELLAAAIKEGLRVRKDDQSFVINAGKELSRMLGDDYESLVAILRRIKE